MPLSQGAADKGLPLPLSWLFRARPAAPVPDAAPPLSRREIAPAVALGAVISIAYAALNLRYFLPRKFIWNIDFFNFVDRGLQFDLSNPLSFVDGLFPMGYAFLMRISVELGLDTLRCGQFLAWFGGLLALMGILTITFVATRSLTLMLLPVGFAAINYYLMFYTTVEGTDMISSGPQFLSLALLWLIVPERQSVRRTRFLVAISAAVLGLSYLMRYTALVLVPCILLYLLWRTWPARRAAGYVALFLGVFLVVTTPQTIPSTIATQQPFFNQQARNVWLGIYSSQADFASVFSTIPANISLYDVIAQDPVRFLNHWAAEMAGFVTDRFVTGSSTADNPLRMWPPALHIACLAALVLVLTDRRWHPANRLLLAMAIVVPTVATAMAWLYPRYLLVPLMAEVVAVPLAADRLLGQWVRLRSPAILVVLGVLFYAIEPRLLVDPSQPKPLVWYDVPPRQEAYLQNRLLRAAGMSDPRLVGTNDPYLHAVDVPARTRYTQTYWAAFHPASLGELLALGRPWQYLVLNYDGGYGDYASIRAEALAAKMRLVPLTLEPAHTTYCVAPCTFPDETPVAARFENGMELVALRFGTGDGVAGLYLYWRAEQVLGRDYTIATSLADAQGHELWQAEGAPQLETYPTTRWTPGTTVVDFRYVDPWNRQGGVTLTIVVRDAAGGGPIPARIAGGALGPVVIPLPPTR